MKRNDTIFTQGRPIRVLVVDDSALMRKMIADMIKESDGLELAGLAKNGLEALELTHKLRPDVITLDIEMPVMDGLKALAKIMEQVPTPVIILSAHAKEGAEPTLLALELGAVDFITKPSGSISLDISQIKHQLVERIRMAATVDLSRLKSRRHPKPVKVSGPETSGKLRLVAIGSSTGGTRALSEILPRMPREVNAAYMLVQHMPLGFTRFLAERLNSRCQITVREAESGDIIEKGLALLAPAGWHLKLASDGRKVELSKEPPRHGVRPSVDVMMESLAQNCRLPMVAVILTGMGHDGAQGLKSIKRRGGCTIAEDRSTCVVYGMPRAAVETGAVDQVLPLDEIPQAIAKACE